jgi:hypothetical protein
MVGYGIDLFGSSAEFRRLVLHAVILSARGLLFHLNLLSLTIVCMLDR